jgi:hypothetical protein
MDNKLPISGFQPQWLPHATAHGYSPGGTVVGPIARRATDTRQQTLDSGHITQQILPDQTIACTDFTGIVLNRQ